METALGLITKCLLGVLSCTYYPVNAEAPIDHGVVMVCPDLYESDLMANPGRWALPHTRLEITNRFGQRLVLQLNCPEGGDV